MSPQQGDQGCQHVERQAEGWVWKGGKALRVTLDLRGRQPIWECLARLASL